MGEFELIRRYFDRQRDAAASGNPVALGIGDDCALLAPRPGMQLAISTDMLVEGRHFFADVDPEALGHKALAVNLSDLAAMGAKPLAFTLALALPTADPVWLEAFAKGLFGLADAHQCTLVGGDTTRGPLNICITVFGEVPVVNGQSQALRRSGAQAGDDVYVSGDLGEARLALLALQGELTLPAAQLQAARLRLERPTPRVALGLALRGIASAAIDLSDGLAGDLGHLLKSSYLGCNIQNNLIIDNFAIKLITYNAINTRATGFNYSNIYSEQVIDVIVAGGDDYELAFTAPPHLREAVQQAAAACGTRVSRIGHMQSQPGLWLTDLNGQATELAARSFDHFSA
jgi:thiamine-monophosphate kinase